MNKKKLQIEQLDKKFKMLTPLRNIHISEKGWINSIRTSLGMSLNQLGKRLGITAQSVRALELREASGSVTIKNLQEAARSLEMQLVYAVIPIGDSLEKMIEKKAREKAEEIISRTTQSMLLENQMNESVRLKKEFNDKVDELKREMPKFLWD